MIQSLHSSYWYRVADLKPGLADHIVLYRHSYRGQRWYVLRNSVTGQQHRFNAMAYFVIARMDGKTTVQQIWESAAASFGDDSPTQDETIQLLARLHGAEALTGDIPPADLQDLFVRQEKMGKQWRQRFKNPFALRFPLIDPASFLDRWLSAISPLISIPAMWCWLIVVSSGLFLAVSHIPELSLDAVDRILSPGNLLLLWLCYPFVKLFHELAHAFVTRFFGGEVHEMGIILLAFTPIPYVEASSSAAFADKRKRMAVAGAGMAVELFIAALALFLWLNVEGGLVSALAYNTFLIAGLNTLLFNFNPLLRFDGYYILSDLIEIPNLAGRSNQYLGYLLQKYLFQIRGARSPYCAEGEKGWLFAYGILAFVYRIFILTGLIFFISSKFFFIGILIAMWAVCAQIVMPVCRTVWQFWNSPVGRRSRKRIVLTAGIPVGIIIFAVLFLPLPLYTIVEGVIWVNDHSQVRTGTDCFVVKSLVDDNSEVHANTPLIQCEDPFLEALVAVKKAEMDELEARYRAQPLNEYVKRAILKDQISLKQADVTRIRERRQELVIRSPHQGLLVLPNQENIRGVYLKKGDKVAFVIDQSSAVVQVAIPQDDVALVLEKTRSIDVRLGNQLISSPSTTITQEVPAASNVLPSAVLGMAGGGVIPVDPDDAQGLRTLKKVFFFELPVTLTNHRVFLGERVYSRFDLGLEPLAQRWYRIVRQLFLRRFNA